MTAGRGRNKETNPIIEIQQYVANVLANHKLEGETDEQATRAAVADMLNIYGKDKIIEAGYGDYLEAETAEETKQEEKTVTHKAKKIEAGRYSYRGYTIYRDKSTTATYWGAWRVWETSGSLLDGESLKDCKNQVDKHIEKIEAKKAVKELDGNVVWDDYCNVVGAYQIASRQQTEENDMTTEQSVINEIKTKIANYTNGMIEDPSNAEWYREQIVVLANELAVRMNRKYQDYCKKTWQQLAAMNPEQTNCVMIDQDTQERTAIQLDFDKLREFVHYNGKCGKIPEHIQQELFGIILGDGKIEIDLTDKEVRHFVEFTKSYRASENGVYANKYIMLR